jgi:hypothetical protein
MNKIRLLEMRFTSFFEALTTPLVCATFTGYMGYSAYNNYSNNEEELNNDLEYYMTVFVLGLVATAYSVNCTDDYLKHIGP